MKKVKVRVGDVFQILTSIGVCFGQVTHKHPKWNFVVAVFRRFLDQPPSDLSAVVAQEPQNVTTFLIEDAVQRGLSTVVGNVPVAVPLRDFPTFRATNALKGDDTMWFF